MTRTLHCVFALLALLVAHVPYAIADDGGSVSVKDDTNGTCPSGFSIFVDAKNPKDENRNGIVCRATAATKGKQGVTSDSSAKKKPEATNERKRAKLSTTNQVKTPPLVQIRIKDDDSGLCAVGSTLVANALGHPADENRNGLVCVKFE